jgi:Ca-activated chloride channel family protein
MVPDIAFDRTVVTVNQGEVVHTLVEFTAPEAQAVERQPVDVVFVVDNSGSMGGAPIVAVREAVAAVLRQLGPEDRAGVVTFESQARLVLPLERHVGDAAQHRVRSIEPAGGTNLSAGWLMAHELIRQDLREGAVRRIVVLTDGQVNQGVTDEDSLATMVVGGRQHSISTSCIGFGQNYQEELLGSLANAGGGNDYWCEGADAAGVVFRQEFDGLANVVAQNVTVTVGWTDAVAVAGVLNDFNVVPADQGMRIDLGDAFGGERRSVLLAFHLRPQPQGGAVDVATVRLAWVSTLDGFAAHEVVVPITVTAGTPGTIDSGADPRVTDEVVLLQAAADRRQARERADRGDFEGGMRFARQAVERLSGLPEQMTEWTQARLELKAMEQRRWSAADSKRSYSATRRMSRKRETQFPNKEDDHDQW